MSFFSRIKNFRPLRSLRAQGTSSAPSIVRSQTPFYELAKPHLLFRLTLPFLAADAIWTLGGCELIWNHWTEPVENAEEGSEDPSAGPLKYAPRPIWQRLGLMTMILTFGGAWALLILRNSGRNVRKLYILPSPTAPTNPKSNTKGPTGSRVFIQCFNQWRSRGRMFDVRDCTLSSIRNSRDLVLKTGRVSGRKGEFALTAEGASMDGKFVSMGAFRNKTMAQFGLKDGGWKSGPIYNGKEL
ncbi:hypothetical protein SERLA73DRAFT_190612 [Serpula lacrymans var. lacrymans S7.3]|uniref:Uncharacterized protein n=2 Tax=Serpula lacrymans var. lacrymans TaxID=341189 RepID=F8QG17_SERL3|nr:uncharacterized protein SERLADRAFT_463475 [Serpula lacrymans var. lacrymans S7.9]EGN92765.1 hypothetical protein SERLA73DRAFT_190612 [Serpula lacrymans var. lacrymans S7.3]EGO26425.1 hypothetical protein SERLADRAFT_463475 [Serpula lacrymans var. lacrymans S7.9]